MTNQNHSGELQDTVAALQERPAAVYPAVRDTKHSLQIHSSLFLTTGTKTLENNKEAH